MANLSAKTGFTPVQTRVSLGNNTTTSVQEFAAYDGQELTGFVFIDATTDYRATVKIQVVKNGAGTYEVAAADIAGDDNLGSPIVSFSMSGSVLRATLVSYAGFVSAYIQYNLNAPALGANFPLTVDGSNVTLATPTVQGSYKAGQAPGLTTGAAIASGYVGQVLENLNSAGTSTATSGATTIASVTLTAGVWLLWGWITEYGASGNTYNLGSIMTAAGTMGTQNGIDIWFGCSATASGLGGNVIPNRIVTLSGSQPYYLLARCPAVVNTCYGGIRAVRIA